MLRTLLALSCLMLALTFDPLSIDSHPDVLAKLQERDLHPSIALTENSIYRKESDAFRGVEFDEKAQGNANPEWRRAVNQLFAAYRPKYHPLWLALKNAPKEVITNKWWLREFYKRYQSAMHVTRIQVFKTPNISTPSQRKRLIAIVSDDDSQDSARSHHKDLERLFINFGAEIVPEDYFIDPDLMMPHLHPDIQDFFNGVLRLYASSSGAWTIAELLSDEWLSTLADGFSSHYPNVAKEDYFDEIFTGHVEIQHMIESVSLTEEIFARKPEMIKPTIEHAKEMCLLLNKLWDNLYGLLQNPGPYLDGPVDF